MVVSIDENVLQSDFTMKLLDIVKVLECVDEADGYFPDFFMGGVPCSSLK